MTATSRLATALKHPVDWDIVGSDDGAMVLEHAARHGVTALLWDSLRHSPETPPRVSQTLAAAVQAAAAQEIVTQREIQRVADACAHAGVPALFIKGTALAYTRYREPWHRPRVDTDVLVAEDSISTATRSLQPLGYRQCDEISTGRFVSHQMAFERTDAHGARHVLDLHWKIANPRMVADALPFELLWHDAQPAPALGPSARVPSPAASLVLACIHRLTHHQGQERLIWLYDMKVLAQSFSAADWARVCTLASAGGVAALCLDGLRAAKECLDAPMPSGIEEALGHGNTVGAARSYVNGRVRASDVLVSDLRSMRSWRQRATLIREHIFPRPAFIRARYGTDTSWLLPLFYVHRLVFGVIKWVRT